MTVACMVVAVVGVLTASSWPSGHPARARMSPDELHQLPPIYRMTYGWTASGERIQAAHQQLVSTCMGRQGLAYPTASPTLERDRDELWPFPFGLETLTQGSRADNGPQPNETIRGDAFGRALYGDPDERVTARGAQLEVSRPATGCLAEAEQRLLGDGRIRRMELTILLHEAEQTALERLDQDPAFRELTARWQRCMTRAGFPARHPRQIMRSLPANAGSVVPPAATADVRCKREVNYLPSAYTTLARYQEELLDGQPSLAGDWAALQERQDAVAETVLTGESGARSP